MKRANMQASDEQAPLNYTIEVDALTVTTLEIRPGRWDFFFTS
jgi:hypothetical protein